MKSGAVTAVRLNRFPSYAIPSGKNIITTHDQVWARQIRSEGLIGAKAAVAFHHWTVETGPVLDEVAEIWDQIDADLAKNEVPTGAARLRRHLEYVAADLADELGAKVKFRADGGYDMGELLSAVISRQGELLKQAIKAAKSWGDDEQLKKVEEFQQARTTILMAKGGEEWVVNKAIHYNEWANLSRNDFTPVVSAFKDLLQQFRCAKPKCDSWLSVTPRHEPVDLALLLRNSAVQLEGEMNVETAATVPLTLWPGRHVRGSRRSPKAIQPPHQAAIWFQLVKFRVILTKSTVSASRETVDWHPNASGSHAAWWLLWWRWPGCCPGFVVPTE